MTWLLNPHRFGSSLLTGLVGWWALEEASGTRYDAHTSSIDLTDVNTVTSGTGKVGTAANFVAANSEYLDYADSGLVFPQGANDVTVALWVKMNTGSLTDWRWFCQHSTTNPLSFSNIDWFLGYDKISTYFYGGVGVGNDEEDAFALTFGTPSVNTWYFLWFEYSSAENKVRISVNNGAINEATVVGTPNSVASPYFRVGAQRSGWGKTDGLIDEVGVWSRQLTSAEITTLYNGGAGITYPG